MNYNMPIVTAIKNYIKKKSLRLHMPGHKGKNILDKKIGIFNDDIFLSDLTEISGLDDLHSPLGAIKEAQELAAKAFGAASTFFLVNGATAGIEAALLAFTKEKTPVIVSRLAHKSIINGLILSGAEPIYINPKNFYNGVPLPITLADLKSVTRKKDDNKVLCLLNPTYEGIVSNIDEIIQYAKKEKMKTIVDEAHGSHFYFSSYFPKNALNSGADIVIHGSHKTIGSLTQSGMLHLSNINDESVISKCLQITQSTSPSYLLLASLDAARWQMENKKEKYIKEIITRINIIKQEIAKIPGFSCINMAELDSNFYDYDITKLVVFCSKELSGYELAKILSEKYLIEVEMAKENYILAMITFADIDTDIYKIVFALRNISKDFFLKNDFSYKKLDNYFIEPDIVFTPRKAFFSSTSDILLKDSVGKICGETIASYPPGIPLIAPGEKIKKDHLEIFKELIANNVHIQGASDPTLKKIRIISEEC